MLFLQPLHWLWTIEASNFYYTLLDKYTAIMSLTRGQEADEMNEKYLRAIAESTLKKEVSTVRVLYKYLELFTVEGAPYFPSPINHQSSNPSCPSLHYLINTDLSRMLFHKPLSSLCIVSVIFLA